MTSLMQCICVLAALALLFLLYMKRAHKYWTRKNVPQIEPISLIWGNLQSRSHSKIDLKFSIKNAYDELKNGGHKHGGFYLFNQPTYIPVDPELIKCIMAKDFQHFYSHGAPSDEKKDPLTANVLNLDGDKWKHMRAKLTPTFTSGKMKMMFSTLLDCGDQMVEHIDRLEAKRETLDIKEILACWTTDIIGSCAFGLECNSFKDPDAEFRKYGRKIFEPSITTVAIQFFRLFAPSWLTKLIYCKVIPESLETFFMGVIKNVMQHRKAGSVKRNDFIQLFLEMEEKAKASGEEPLTLEQVAAQAFVFFVAGFETSSTTMTFCLHELAHNPDIQDKVRDEVRETMRRHGGKLTYDGIMEMKYLDLVVNETLRKYPPLPILVRKCTSDYKVPDLDVTIEEGTRVFISSLGVQRDEEYYPDPQKFDPERFTEKNKAKRPAYTFLPFGEGPRICIGLRFGLMQTKTGVVLLLNKYRLFPGPNEKYNIELNPKAFILAKKGTLTLSVERLPV